jgi:hypothetical protein
MLAGPPPAHNTPLFPNATLTHIHLSSALYYLRSNASLERAVSQQLQGCIAARLKMLLGD